MNKHIVGFILFNLIVGTSIIIAAFFYQMPKYDSVVVTPVTSETYTRSCWKSNSRFINNTTSPKVTQAVFDSKTHELKTELFFQTDARSIEDIKLALHFFVKDSHSTRFVGTENLTREKFDMTNIQNISDIYDTSERRMIKAEFSGNSSPDWLDDLKPRENLYVMTEFINTGMNRDYTPVFNEANATPVMLAR